jgi:glycosyltransferase involved in cell wall biosynthesis
MKTLLFCNLIPLKTGAYEALLAAIGQEFRKSGDEYVVVFSGDPIPPVAESLRASGVRWHILKQWADGPGKENAWGFVLPAVRLIRLERPDVVAVHFGNEMPTLVASLLCRLMGWGSRLYSIITTRQLSNSTTFHPPRWVWEQDQQIQDPGKISRWASKLRIMGLGVDRYLAVYEGGRHSMLKRGIPAEKITVIHNSVAPYAPTRPKGWLRQELGAGRSGQWALSSGQGSEKKSDAQVAADVPAAEIESANQAHRSPFDFAHGRPGTSLRQGYVGQASNATMRNAPYASHLTSHVSPPEVLLITNGSLIPRKRIDFILRACALLQKEKSFEQPPSPRLRRPGKPAKPAKGEVGDACGEKPHALDFEMHPTAGEAYTPQPPCPELAEGALRSSRASVQNLNFANWRLLVIGEGPERERLGALAAELGIADRVHFLGLRNDVREILPECDIYLHAAIAEACAYSILEAMAAGLSAIVTNVGAAQDQIASSSTGWVVLKDNFKGYFLKLIDLVINQEERRAMGKSSKERWQDLYHVDIAARRYSELYASMSRRDKIGGNIALESL